MSYYFAIILLLFRYYFTVISLLFHYYILVFKKPTSFVITFTIKITITLYKIYYIGHQFGSSAAGDHDPEVLPEVAGAAIRVQCSLRQGAAPQLGDGGGEAEEEGEGRSHQARV